MDFNRFGQNRPANRSTTAPAEQPAAAKPAAAEQEVAGGFKQSRAYRWSFLALLISATILIIATIFFIAYGRTMNREAHYVKNDQYQAVFVNVNGTNGGQVYFGHINDMNGQYIRLTDVFYIQNQTTQDGQANGSYNLVKLGCELHGPNDEMLINRTEVFFWENLKNDSQVAQKAAEFHKQNPNGQKCNTAAGNGSTQQSNATTQAPATGTNGATNTAPATGTGATTTGGTTTTQGATTPTTTPSTTPAKKQ